jgi:hypothetical protein
LEAAIEHADSHEARRIVAQYDFSAGQRRHVERLIDEWEHDLRLPARNLKPRGLS